MLEKMVVISSGSCDKGVAVADTGESVGSMEELIVDGVVLVEGVGDGLVTYTITGSVTTSTGSDSVAEVTAAADCACGEIVKDSAPERDETGVGVGNNALLLLDPPKGATTPSVGLALSDVETAVSSCETLGVGVVSRVLLTLDG
ncbi:unnamed protein product [Penicillium salamii]|uniref:Uncharacterized protein n=1 Tax=Penicillium salamii TaxID=1612424 RepID=A0A9W4NEA7_9EURO|nr:unnamed protein product [Penicillium salamii]CAG8047422.1 unnamed protein product [Penicillium salamii]CAG8064609.1 unnamed protein product [Penicillium salamii]CAG8226694.1 unnamed protein product [Penicillium salamii]CAG8269979.1 unnamed protein product [Penicillium salamii]